MSKSKILIVGCGAVGLSQGYHLSAAADITYLVRPGRKPAFVPPKRLYDYKENALRVFDNYRVIESANEVAGERFLFVFDTLDGHTARSEGGTSTLKAVGELIRETEAFVLYDAIGLDMEEHYAKSMSIGKERLLLAMSMLTHQPTPMISIPSTADRELVKQADLLYDGFPGHLGLMVFNTRPKLVKTLQATYAKNGKLKVAVHPAFLSAILPIGMLHLVVWNIDGYRPFPHLKANNELWGLMLRAQRETLALPRFGWTGWVFSWVLGSWATARLLFQAQVDGALPMAFHEFNAFHHGGKVVKQDIAMLEDIAAEGERVGRKMVALREVVRRAEETERLKEEERVKAKADGEEGVRKRV
ncbi:hypothetical protein K458DRAFT_36429 [Lentithecium fluviatile CBS 122367]|uniref:Uncharacterized protein n=1 Tax=Lentithecium fluviatile CBS 122367 TaxID=1168545 RepID=A0A6G1J161_9PLEO|nr:hypothetical protein K458DRAFT_36429 [Lentithecium fluviatile CBS 122367]